jgi:hypothetical protein
MPTPAETLARARARFVSERPDLDPEPPLAVLAPRIGPDARIRRVDGRVISLEDSVALLIRAADAEAQPVQAPRSTAPPEVDLIAYQRGLLAQRAREAAQPRSVDQVLTRLASPLDKIGTGR